MVVKLVILSGLSHDPKGSECENFDAISKNCGPNVRLSRRTGGCVVTNIVALPDGAKVLELGGGRCCIHAS
jgi:hypothetical protein